VSGELDEGDLRASSRFAFSGARVRIRGNARSGAVTST
jgi:hypothetical protein